MHCFYGANFGRIVFHTAFLMVQDYIKKNAGLQFCAKMIATKT